MNAFVALSVITLYHATHAILIISFIWNLAAYWRCKVT